MDAVESIVESLKQLINVLEFCSFKQATQGAIEDIVGEGGDLLDPVPCDLPDL